MGQQGRASHMRNTKKVRGKDKRILNQVIHSTEKRNPITGQRNPFYDPTQSYDSAAEKHLDRIQKKYDL